MIAWQLVDDGALGQNTWRPDHEGWRIEANGTAVEGKPGTATNVLTPVVNDSFTWRFANRTLDGEPIQDTPPVKITRER